MANPKFITLSSGHQAIVDEIDHVRLSAISWRPEYSNGIVYAKSNLPRDERGIRKTPRMHQLILPPIKGKRVDHADGNGLNNRRGNLRYASVGQQKMNSAKRTAGVSRFKGVYPNRKGRGWKSTIRLEGKTFYLGLFSTEELAAEAYDKAAIRMFGEFAKTNGELCPTA